MYEDFVGKIIARRNEALDEAVCVEVTNILKEVGMDTVVELNPKAIIKAFQKQIPVIPLYIEGDYDFPLCPSCKQSVDENMEDNFCSVCGQALKWGD